MMADSILCCQPKAESIADAMQKAMTPGFRQIAEKTVCPFGDGNSSDLIFGEIIRYLQSGPHDSKKSFYDIRFEIE